MNALYPSTNKRPAKGFLAQSLLITALIAGVTCNARAAGIDATWTGLSPVDSNWSSVANWSPSGVPGNGNTATFIDAGNGRTVINTGNIFFKNIIFDTASVAAYTLGTSVGGNTLTMNSAGAIAVNSTVTNDQTINANILTSVSGGDRFTNNSATAVLHLDGAISMASAAGAATSFAVNGSGATAISGAVSNGSGFALGLAKSGAGTLTLSGTNTYTGATAVTAGTLIINGDQSAATGAVSASVGTTLSGNGIVGGATTITNATLSAGTSAGSGNLRFSNSLTLVGSSMNTVFDIAGSTRGVTGGYDAITVDPASLLTYSGALTLNITSSLSTGTFDLFSFGTGLDAGGFNSVAITGGIYTGYTFSQTLPGSGIWVAANAGNTFTFTEATGDLSLVPEPSIWSCLFLGLGVVGLLRHRRLLSA